MPPRLDGADALELGCGTGYVSAWLARRGARPVGVDNSAAQLATAAELQDRFRLRFPLIQASAEQAPFTDAAFDLVISDMAPASGATRMPGFPKRPGYCARAVN